MPGVTDAAFLELLASYEAALEAAKRSLTIAQALTEAHQTGRPLPDAVVVAYAAGLERDEARLAELSEHVQRFKSWFRVH
jgi:hypothetical protein